MNTQKSRLCFYKHIVILGNIFVLALDAFLFIYFSEPKSLDLIYK